MKQVIVQNWTETERGWGQRPDGYTIHLTEAERLSFIEQYNNRLDKMYGNNAPDEYSFPDGDAYIGDIEDYIYDNLIIQKNEVSDGYGMWGPGKILPPKHITNTTYDNELKSKTNNKKSQRRTLGKMG